MQETDDGPLTTSEELVRLAAFRHLAPLDAVGDPMLQRIASLAALVTGSTYAGLHFLDDEQQHRVASRGAPLDATSREDSMCRLVVDGGEPIQTADATLDPRFGYSSYVAGDQPVRSYASAPLFGDGDQVIGTVCAWDTHEREPLPDSIAALEDLAALVTGRLESLRANRILAEAATQDPLTGLANRRSFLDATTRALGSSSRRGQHVAVLFLDLDGFKAVNDVMGHDTGDDVLRTFAQRLLATCRSNELAARLGGDEFVVLLEDTGAEEASKAARRIADGVDGTIGSLKGDVRVGVSVGVALSEQGEAADALIRRADLAMYAVKAERRGRKPSNQSPPA
jgi:diguanylate cyclase (GGDEF)-like protein